MNSSTLVLPSTASWRKLGSHHRFEHYYRLALLVVIVNAIIYFQQTQMTSAWLNTLAIVNISIAILVRQQYVINLFFKMATCTKTYLPLAIRWRLGKVYHFGGLHVGAAISGTAFFLLFTLSLSQTAWQEGEVSPQLMLCWAAVILLLSMIATATPHLRSRYHNLFERTHRFAGWTLLGIFIALQLFKQINTQAVWYLDIGNWLIACVTFSILLPWLRLKKVPVDIEKHSNHAVIAKFDYGMTPFPGSSMAISHNPLLEWHSFATIPSPNKPGFRLAISRAGDWTGDFVDNPPKHVWVKGIATAGVANIEVLFKRVIYVATGSGIGPVLPHLLAKQVDMHLIWTTRSPRTTYGDNLVDEILQAEPSALIYNTDELGKPDMVNLALDAYQHYNAEAVIVISNQKLTRKVVYELECMGIPSFGAIWDS